MMNNSGETKELYHSELQEWNNSGETKELYHSELQESTIQERQKNYIIQNYRNEQFRKRQNISFRITDN